MSETLDNLAMGSGGWAKLYGDRLADSSLLECAVATRWVFLYMLARADKTGRFRCASVPGLARAAAVTLPEAAAAVRELEAPDPDSTSPEEEGRRILRIPGGWQIVNKAKYRDYQTAKQKADAEKKQRQREAARRNRQELEAENVRLREQIGGGTCPGTSPGLPGTSAQEEREQRLETSNGERISGADAPAPPSSADVKAKGNGTAARKGTSRRDRPNPPPWSTEACDLWRKAYGGTAPGGRIGKALKPLVEAHGWEAVRRAWSSYLDQADAEYASPQRFAATYGRWSGSVLQKGSVARPAAVRFEVSKREIQEWARRHDALE